MATMVQRIGLTVVYKPEKEESHEFEYARSFPFTLFSLPLFFRLSFASLKGEILGKDSVILLPNRRSKGGC